MIAINEYLLLMLLVAIVAGLIGSLIGIGGGIFIVPALTLGFGIPIPYAIGASIISIIATSSGAASAYVRDRITNVRVGMFLETGTVVGSILGASGTLYLAKSGLAWVTFIAFGAILLFLAYNIFGTMRSERRGKATVNQTPSKLADRLQLRGEYYDNALQLKVRYIATKVPAGLATVFFSGVVSGLLGIGAGALNVLGMDKMMRLPFKVSTTTSNFMIGVTAAASTAILYVNGYVNMLLAAPVAIGVVLGSFIGTKVLVRSRPTSIRLLFVVVLVILGIQMIQRGIF